MGMFWLYTIATQYTDFIYIEARCASAYLLYFELYVFKICWGCCFIQPPDNVEFPRSLNDEICRLRQLQFKTTASKDKSHTCPLIASLYADIFAETNPEGLSGTASKFAGGRVAHGFGLCLFWEDGRIIFQSFLNIWNQRWSILKNPMCIHIHLTLLT